MIGPEFHRCLTLSTRRFRNLEKKWLRGLNCCYVDDIFVTADRSLKDWQQLSQGLDIIKLTCLACLLTFTNALKSLNHFACGNVMFNQTRSSKMNVCSTVDQTIILPLWGFQSYNTCGIGVDGIWLLSHVIGLLRAPSVLIMKTFWNQ